LGRFCGSVCSTAAQNFYPENVLLSLRLFCLAISTVFQAFFVSYLVEPKYEKKLETLDEVLESDVVYGYHPIYYFFQDTLWSELANFLEHKKLREDCSDIWKCVERTITQRDISAFIPAMFPTYVASEMGFVDVGKVVCNLDDALISAGAIVLLKKGNPLLDRFNILMRRYLEAGLMEKLWTELQHRASLRGGGRFGEAAGDKFFAFSFSHLLPACVVLLVGTVLSPLLFVVELILNSLCKRKKNIRAFGE
jgi:hypothetical protein